MIEIEKNFDLQPGDKERLIRDAELLGKKSFTDVYYDNASYDLTGGDFWLRERDGRFELKVPLNEKGESRAATDRYKELESDEEIGRELGLDLSGKDLRRALAELGYSPFATITTEREQYRKEDFHLDFDEVPALNYTTTEIELMMNTPEETPAAEERILQFAKQHGLVNPGHGKVIEYLRRHNPPHLQLLKEKGVVRD